MWRWRLLVPAHRYVFTVEDGAVVEHLLPGDTPADRFRRYQALKPRCPVHGMIAWPNTVLLQGPLTVVVDPGIVMQGPPVLLALARLGLGPDDVDLVVNTHGHADHSQADVLFPGLPVLLHAREEVPRDADQVTLVEGAEGELAPGLSYVLTPGHTEGSISLVVETGEGRVIVAGDTVGPLPEYFERMALPPGFPGRDALLESWRRLRRFSPALVIPGHNPPMAI